MTKLNEIFKKLLKIIFGDKRAKIIKKINKQYVKAVHYQRNGNIEMYSKVMKDISRLEDKLN
jgi:hypothetical protein